MKKTGLLAFLIASGVLLSGCSTVPCCDAPKSDRALPAQGSKILAIGHGAMGLQQSNITTGQQKLMAMRAARVDAYRNLAEQVYGFRVWGNTAVSAFATQNDNIRTYVDAYIRGARLVSMAPMGDGNYEATVELELTPNFLSCVASKTLSSSCSLPTATVSESLCPAAGCVQPSAYYYTYQ